MKPGFSRLAFIALGSNLGNSGRTILRAMDQLQALSDGPILRSSLWRTAPVNCPPGSPVFVNAVVGLVPCDGETPESLLKKLQALERGSGRQAKRVPNEPRPLDLDLIAFGPQVLSVPELTLPHPRVHHRAFVLQPLSEIAPNLIIPGQEKTVSELLAGLDSHEMLARLTT